MQAAAKSLWAATPLRWSAFGAAEGMTIETARPRIRLATLHETGFREGPARRGSCIVQW